MAALPLYFNSQDLPALISALSDPDESAVRAVPGVTAHITGAAANALGGAFVVSLSKLWIAAAVLSAAGAVGESTAIPPSYC